MKNNQHSALSGVFLLTKSKEQVEKRLSDERNRYNAMIMMANRFSGSRYVREFKAVCRKLMDIINDCFVTDMAAASRCLNRLKRYYSTDNPTWNMIVDLGDILWRLGIMVSRAIPLQDLPSCKKLTELSKEDAIAAAKDLVGNNIVKSGISLVLLGVKIGELVQIEDVKAFYDNLLEALQTSIEESGRSASEVEIFLEYRFKAEIGYCVMAMIKTGIGASKEKRDLIDSARQAIQAYEQEAAHIPGIPSCLPARRS